LRSGGDYEHGNNKKINKEEFGGKVTSGHLLGRCLTLRKKKGGFQEEQDQNTKKTQGKGKRKSLRGPQR
jgi:hypothetical protein